MQPDRYDEAKRIAFDAQKMSPSYLQRTMNIGYNEASRYIERMQAEGICTPANSKGVRGIVAPGSKTREQRQAESRAAELDRPRREAARAAEAEAFHKEAYGDVLEALERAGIDPERLREWLAGPTR